MTETQISPAEALRLMREQGYTYVDVRTVPEYELGHPEGAKNIPWQQERGAGAVPDPKFVENTERQFARDAKLIVGCHTANRSVKAATALRGAGFTDVLVQRAGWAGLKDAFGGAVEPGWEALGLPASKS
jgi:rhodanese-related sulfurtransferase